MTVVVAIGILSSMGIASLNNAIVNSRVKDAAVNSAAFLERVGNAANRLSSPVCIKLENNDKTIKAYKGENCNAPGGFVDEFTLDEPLTFVKSNETGCASGVNLLADGSSSVFVPKIGLSAVPAGMVCAKYGSSNVYGSAEKTATVNYVKAKWSVGGSAMDL